MFKKIFVIFFLCAFTFSCTFKLLPPANAGLVTDITKLQNDIQTLYDSPDPGYSEPAYQRIDTEIAAIVAAEQSRPHAKGNIKAATNIQSIFSLFKANHKAKGTLTANVRTAYKDDMFGAIRPLLIGELSIK